MWLLWNDHFVFESFVVQNFEDDEILELSKLLKFIVFFWRPPEIISVIWKIKIIIWLQLRLSNFVEMFSSSLFFLVSYTVRIDLRSCQWPSFTWTMEMTQNAVDSWIAHLVTNVYRVYIKFICMFPCLWWLPESQKTKEGWKLQERR